MHAFLIVMLVIHSMAILGGLIHIANRTEQKPITPTLAAVGTFIRIVVSGWILYLLAQGV